MNKNYPLYNWITTIIIGPILFTVYEILFKNESISSMLEMIPLFILMGIIFSIPVLILNILIFNLLSKIITSKIFMKFILTVVGITGVVVTFKIIGGTLSNNLTIYYSIAIILSSIFVKLKNVELNNDNNNGRPWLVSRFYLKHQYIKKT